MDSHYDIVVIGAGIGGSTAGILFGREGYNVLVLDKFDNQKSYKKICTHFIQPSSVPVIQELGIEEKMRAAGALPNSIEVWSPHGWVKPTILDRSNEHCNYGYNVTRETLDPILHETLENTENVTVKYQHNVRELQEKNGRITGVKGDADGEPFNITASLVILADGRKSKLAERPDLPKKTYPNERFAMYAYYKGVSIQCEKHSQFWFCGKNSLFAYPLSNDTTLLCVFADKSEYERCKADRDQYFTEEFSKLPNGPLMADSERISDFRGMYDLTNHIRKASAPGLALVGDTALAADPMSGVGCGWAFQSAQWLFEETHFCIKSRDLLDHGLKQYANKHYRTLNPHAKFIFSASYSRDHNFTENMIFKAATKDNKVANALNDFIARNISVWEFLSPLNIARIFYSAWAK